MSSSNHQKDTEINSSVQEECWGLSSDFELFANYQVKTVYYPPFVQNNNNHNEEDNNNFSNSSRHDNVCNVETQSFNNNRKSFKIEFMEPNSPLDILNKDTSSIQYDATGHCVWAGAFLLIECIKHLQKYLLGNKRVIEFGCGTGIGGLALAFSTTRGTRRNDMSTFVCFTDTDPAVLEVCQRNCNLNNLQSDNYSIKELTWGEKVVVTDQSEYGLYDIGLATDVLYDIDLMDPLFSSVTKLVITGGIFILSHIPRACYNEGNPLEAVQDLDKYIVDKAETYGLVLDEIIRPPCPQDLSREILTWCSKEAFHGAGLFVFLNKKEK